jgi:hypothetical protein
VLTLAAIGAVAILGACTGEVVVQAQLQQDDGNAMPLSGLTVRALPYDRDVVFDSLRNAYGQPEPSIPDTILALQDSIAEASLATSQAENQWGAARDSLRVIREAMDRLTRGSPQYRLLFNDFNAQEVIATQAERRMNQAFARYTALQNRFTQTANEIKVRREEWADQAYAAIDTVIFLRLEELGLEEHADTTDDNGVARFPGLKKGQWWVHARYTLPFEELYWNEPVEVTGGDPNVVVLNRENAESRPNF